MLRRLFLYLFDDCIQSIITTRLTAFRRMLERQGQIKTLPGIGPKAD